MTQYIITTTQCIIASLMLPRVDSSETIVIMEEVLPANPTFELHYIHDD